MAIPLFPPPAPAPWCKASLDFMVQDLKCSILTHEDLDAYPITDQKYGAPAYVIPYNGNPNLYRIRVDREQNKYLAPANIPPDIWIPPGVDMEALYDGDLIIVEGEKKAACVHKHWNLPNVVGIGGCWNAVVSNPETKAYKLVERLQLLITPGRVVRVILDGDVIENKNVGRAALTLKSCIENLNGQMLLYMPPVPELKGVDDWIAHDPLSMEKFSAMILVDFSKLSINRTLLYAELGCHLNDKGMLILNELNGYKLLEHHFKSQGIVKDKRLGFIDRDANITPHAKLGNIALHYLQGDISPRYTAGSIHGALSEYISNNDNMVDMVQDFVKNRIKWDGVKRLDTWGNEYFESKIPRVAEEWGRLLITSLVMRVLEPGCKADTVLILNGPQGIGKTTFFEDLACIDNFDFYRAISDLPGTGSDDRTFKQAITAALVIDLSEGVIFESRKTNSDRLKQFITERFDEYRVAYAKSNTVAPRGYIFVGTTNRTDQLTDYTGSRRFFYLNVTKIKRMDYATKLQLFAEASATIEAIKATNWYDIHVTMDDLPEQMKDENPHVTKVSELLNVEHYRSDAVTEALQALLDIGDPSRFNKSEVMVVTPNYIAARLGHMGDFTFINRIGRKLVELNTAPIFPYSFIKERKRMAQIDFKQGHKELYTGHITNDQGMFTCFTVKRK